MTITFHVWGCRGGRNVFGSRIGRLTSCYSVRAGDDLFVFDAGRGLGVLADSVIAGEQIARVHVLVTHAHVDHWEGLRDAAWFWTKNRLAVTILGPAEALDAIRRGHEPPSFVSLDVLAQTSVASLAYVELEAGTTHAMPGATLATHALHHYSGIAPARRYLETLGYHLAISDGPRIAYLCDHEPTPDTEALEASLLDTSDLALVDANYGELAEHAFGHGSLAHAGALARRHPRTSILATHHGPTRSDEAIAEGANRHAFENLAIASDGMVLQWNGTRFA